MTPTLTADDAPLHRRRREIRSRRHEPVERIHGGDARAGDRRRARSAVGHEHVAIELDGVFAEAKIVEHRANAPPDEPLNLLRPTADLRCVRATCASSSRAAASRTRP